MKLTYKHLNIIHDGIVKLDCQSCNLIKDCYAHEDRYCREITEWLRKEGEGIIMKTKIKIIKNAPIDDLASDITKLIGQVFEATINNEGHAEIQLDCDFIIYNGEYEIVEEENN